MLHAEYITGNPLTGKQIWLIRHIVGCKYGDPFDWVVLLERKTPISKVAYLHGMCGHGIDKKSHKELLEFLGQTMDFREARALRNGRWKTYRIK